MDARNRKPNPLGGFFVGIVFFAVGWVWKSTFGSAMDAADRLFLGIFQFFGALALLYGFIDMVTLARRRQAREAALRPSDAFGSAAFATLEECRKEGLLDPRGLYLGLLDGQPLFYSGKAHLITIAPARQGKGIGVVIPNLLHWQGSAFVTDPKGELAAVTAQHRKERFGHKVFVLNPWGLHNLPRHRFNPLQPLLEAASDPVLVRGIADEAKALALQLIPEPEDAKNAYFRDGSRQILRSLMLHFATRGDPENCTLTELWRTVNSPKQLAVVVTKMERSKQLNGAIAALAEDLSFQIKDNPDQFADFRQGAVQALDIFDPVGWLGDAVSGSDVDFASLKAGRATIYLVIPQDRIDTHGRWLGLVARQAITAVARSKGTTPVLFMLDEFANMGKLTGLAESLTALPGLGVRVWAFVQELAEIVRLYGPNTAQTLLSQAEVMQLFAVQNLDFARRISASLGQQTVKTRSYGLGSRTDHEVTESVGETAQPLLTPDQLRQLPADEQLLFVTRLPPIKAKRIPFWCIQPWGSWVQQNPVEGSYPTVPAVITLNYRKKAAGGQASA